MESEFAKYYCADNGLFRLQDKFFELWLCDALGILEQKYERAADTFCQERKVYRSLPAASVPTGDGQRNPSVSSGFLLCFLYNNQPVFPFPSLITVSVSIGCFNLDISPELFKTSEG